MPGEVIRHLSKIHNQEVCEATGKIPPVTYAFLLAHTPILKLNGFVWSQDDINVIVLIPWLLPGSREGMLKHGGNI